MRRFFKDFFRRLWSLVTIIIILGTILALSPYPWRLLYRLDYRDIIVSEAEGAGVDPALVAAIINVESGWRAEAVSPRGARGLMQLIPTTAEWISGKCGAAFSEEGLFIPEVNICLGVAYLADLFSQFGNNQAVVLAAYNGGRGNVKNWLDTAVWNGELASVSDIPFGETRRYVEKVTAQRRIYDRIYSWPRP